MAKIPTPVRARGAKFRKLAGLLTDLARSTNRLESVVVVPSVDGVARWVASPDRIVLELPPLLSQPLLPPFTVYLAANPDAAPGDPANCVRVTPGTVGNFLPSNYDQLIQFGDAYLTAADVAGYRYGYLYVEAEIAFDSNITIGEVTIRAGSEVPENVGPPDGPPTTMYAQLGVVTVNATTGDIIAISSTLQRSIYPRVVVTNVTCALVSRDLLY